jgi:starch synthase
MQVIFVASEAVPFAKTGGLGDVLGALPRAIEREGHAAAIFLPGYRSALAAGVPQIPTGITVRVPIASQMVEGNLIASTLPGSGVKVYVIDQPRYFDRDGLYGTSGIDYDDNCERFVFFNRAVLEALDPLGLRPDIIHCNDWQTGLIPVYLKTLYLHHDAVASTGSLLTIHNLAYLGLFWQRDMALTGLDWRLFNWRQLEFHGRISLLKAGLVFADMFTAVSPSYAKEIQTPRFGSGLDGLLRDRQADLRGIVNGIDPEVWSPARAPQLACNYDAATVAAGKAACKAWLQRRAGLAQRPEIPLLAQIGRLVPQKGWDLLALVAEDLLERDIQLVVLGEGERKYHALLENLARRFPDKCWAHLAFSDELAHQIEAGADIFLMPSLFEPCGLNQLYSLAHGTIPIVRATGGLADTVVDTNQATLAAGTATGFVFAEADPHALLHTIDRALSYWSDRSTWRKLMATGMSADWSWQRSAREYVAIYDQIKRKLQSRTIPLDSSDPLSRAPARSGTA